MANRKMTLLKTKLAESVSASVTNKARNLGIATALLLSSSNALALGLGPLEVASNLDQPLNGTIELRVSEGDDLDTLTAVIASREDFESLGIDYPSYLENFSLLLDTLGGERQLRVTSNNIVIKEPFIHFLVRVEWSGGSFLREYTALIDPPVYASESPTSIAEPREVGIDRDYRADGAVVAQDLPEERPLIEDNFYNDDESNQAVVETASSRFPTDARYGPVESGESLSVIAQDLQRQFPDLSIYQIMKVLFDENQNAFIGGNINGLIKGSILNVGDLDAIRSVDISDSRAFYSRQIQEWDPQLLQASNTGSINVGQDNYSYQDDSSSSYDDSGSDSYESEDSFQVGASTASNDYVSSDQGASSDGEVLALSQQVTSLQSSLASSELENQELSERISLLEGQLADMNRLAELSIEDADLSVLESALAEQNNRASESDTALDEITESVEDTSAIDEFLTSTEDTTQDLSDEADAAIDGLAEGDSSIDEFLSDNAEENIGSDDSLSLNDDVDLGSVVEEIDGTTSEADVIPEVKAPLIVKKEPSFLEKAKSSFFEGGLWKILAGLGGLLAIGGGLLFMRRRQADEEFEISMLSIESNSHSVGHSNTASASASMSHTASVASEAANADKETSFLTVYSDSDAVVQADEVDPVAEADVYIAYGRDEQAEEVLLDGVVSHPDRVDIKQKLLSLYHKRQNVEGFERIAEELYSQRASLTGDVWQQVCEMGKEVAPSNPLFELSGDDLNAAVEADSEMQLEGDSIAEVPLEPASIEFEAVEDTALDNTPESDSGDLEFVVDAVSDDPLEDQLSGALVSEDSDLNEVLTINDDSELLMDSLNTDESIQLVNFDDGRSEVSELDEVEIDALELSGDLNLAANEPNLEEDSALESSLADDDGELLDFNLEDLEDDNDVELSVGESQEVSDLEIDSSYDEARTQYELAKVFVDLGDEDGARKILVELVENKENSADVLSDSQALLDSISS